jgi:hypothetical protein
VPRREQFGGWGDLPDGKIAIRDFAATDNRRCLATQTPGLPNSMQPIAPVERIRLMNGGVGRPSQMNDKNEM